MGHLLGNARVSTSDQQPHLQVDALERAGCYAAARARGRQGGRPSVMTAHKLQVAQVMHGSGQYTVAAIAKTLGVSRASIHRHLTNSDR